MSRERIAAAAILIVGIALRFYDLSLKPLHHDEGVNGFFMLNLYRGGFSAYKYDPSNYHGPSLYFMDLPFLKLMGLQTDALRILPALFGVGVLLLILCLWRQLGPPAVLWASALAAVSPGMVFISRYFIHEMMVVFFTLGIVVAVVWYLDTWRAIYLFLAVASFAFLVATKETAVPTAIVMLIAWGCTAAQMHWIRLRAARYDRGGRKKKRRQETPSNPTPSEAESDLLPHQDMAVILWCAVVFLAINYFLYTSFTTNKGGVIDAFRSMAFWASTGKTAHLHPWWQYCQWLCFEEGAAFVVGWLGILIALLRSNNALAVFFAWYATGLLSMYSLEGYKTPWLCVNFVMPFAIMAGWALAELGRSTRTFALLIGVICLGWSFYCCQDLNFYSYDANDDHWVYSYAHTFRDYNHLLADINTLAGRGKGLDSTIFVVAPDYWPLPWSLRNYPHALFWGHMEAPKDADLIIAEDSGTENETGEIGLFNNHLVGAPPYPAMRPLTPLNGGTASPKSAVSASPSSGASGAPSSAASGGPSSAASGSPSVAVAGGAVPGASPSPSPSPQPKATPETNPFVLIGTYRLRPGVDLKLWARQSLGRP